ncbi:MAG: NAD(P)H-binding protein [Chryseolinea sp.]
MKSALIAGATGLIGNQLLQMLLSSERYSKVTAIVRNKISDHPKLNQVSINLGDPHAYGGLYADDVFCCLGTTIAKAGSKEKFREVDFEYPLALARTMKAAGASQYLLVSALGAKKDSSIFYNQVKGEVEDSVINAGYQCVHIFRPSLLLGDRKEKRSGEEAAKVFYKIFGFLIPSKYKSIESRAVANAMRHFASRDQKGTFIHESGSLQPYN